MGNDATRLCKLTGLPMYHALPAAIRELFADEHSVPVEAVLLDVDGLIYLNDAKGHEAGDEALRALGSLLKEHVAAMNVAAYRVRGEEFLVILSGRSRAEAFTIAQCLVDDTAALRIPYSRFDDPRDYLAVNAVVFTATTAVLNAFAELQSDISELAAHALYDEKQRSGLQHSLVVRVELSDPSTSSRLRHKLPSW